jgi:hypothetical protein
MHGCLQQSAASNLHILVGNSREDSCRTLRPYQPSINKCEVYCRSFSLSLLPFHHGSCDESCSQRSWVLHIVE